MYGTEYGTIFAFFPLFFLLLWQKNRPSAFSANNADFSALLRDQVKDLLSGHKKKTTQSPTQK